MLNIYPRTSRPYVTIMRKFNGKPILTRMSPRQAWSLRSVVMEGEPMFVVRPTTRRTIPPHLAQYGGTR